MALARFLTFQFDDGGVIEITSVSFIGIDVDFEFCVCVFANEQIVEGDGALGAFDFQGHKVAVFHTVVRAIAGIDMNVTSCADDTFFEFDGTGGADENATWRTFDVTAMANGCVDAQGDRIGEREFDLACFACWTEDAHVGDHPASRADDHDCFCGCKKTVLIEVFFGGKFFPFSEEFFDVLIGQVNVASGDTYDQFRNVDRGGCAIGVDRTGIR